MPDHEQYSEPEETAGAAQSAQPMPDDDMLTSEPMIDRPHAGTTATGPTVGEFQPPPFTGVVEEEGPKDPTDNPLANPGLKDAPPHVKQKGADFLADKLLKGYGNLKKTVGGWVVSISERKLDKLEERDLIDRNILLPLRDGGHVSAGSMIERHNEYAETVINENALSKEFYDEAKPMIVEELVKRDIALTNLQQLAAITAIDMYNFSEAMKPLWEQKHDLINSFKEATAAFKAGGYASYQQATQPSPPPTPPPPSQAEQPVSPPPPPPASSGGSVNDPAAMFDEIQSRGGIAGVNTTATPGPQQYGPTVPAAKPPRIRKPYKKKPYKRKPAMPKRKF